MSLVNVEKLVQFLMRAGVSETDLCKFLVLDTFAHLKISTLYAAEITDDGYIAPIGTFGLPAEVVARWGNIPLSLEAPLTESVKKDKVLLLEREVSFKRYPNLAIYDGLPEKWETYLVCPILPHGLIALTLDSKPKIDNQFESFLKTVGAITMSHFNRSKFRSEQGAYGGRENRVKKSGVLTERQNTILRLMEKGLSNPTIAEQIGYSESLVRQETMAIYATLKVSGRKELIERKKD